MTALVGYTGFVGSNICHSAGREIEALYNSQNIKDAFGTKPDLLIYAGVRAEKYLANHAPEKDMEKILQAENNIKKIQPQKLVLISTIDVFQTPRNVDETSVIDAEGIHGYGYNRYQLELWVREQYPDALIIRLPGLFGRNIKKNFIYDFINVIPFRLKETKFQELVKIAPELKRFYDRWDDGFYQVNVTEKREKELLKTIFRELGFSALNFTDSRSVYQFYDLSHLWRDIKKVLQTDITLWHPATEPISAGELYEYLTGEKFINELEGIPADYNYKTVYGKLFGKKAGYINSKMEIMSQISKFVSEQEKL